MDQNFETALKWTLAYEGGWSDHPKDPGGATMKGVTMAVFEKFKGRECSKTELRNISDEDLLAIYKGGYWNKVPCGPLASGVDALAFDIAVNSGPGRVRPWLNATEKMSAPDRVRAISAKRASFFQSLRTFSTFGKGWMRRCADLEAKCLKLAVGKLPVPASATLLKEADIAKKAVRNNATGAGGVAVMGPAATVQADPASLPWWASVVIVAAIGIPFVILIYNVALHQARAKAMQEIANV